MENSQPYSNSQANYQQNQAQPRPQPRPKLAIPTLPFKNTTLLIKGSILLVLLLVGSFIIRATLLAPRRTATVVGVGEKTVIPEKAQISFSLVESANTRQLALTKGTEKFSSIITGLSQYNPETVNDTGAQVTQGEVAAKTGQDLYQYVNAASITIPDPNRAQEVVSYLYNSGASLVGQVRFIPKDKEKVDKEVRELAIKDAKEKIKQMARAAGSGVGKVMTITEGASNSNSGTPISGKTSTTNDTSAVGEITLQSVVSVTYELK